MGKKEYHSTAESAACNFLNTESNSSSLWQMELKHKFILLQKLWKFLVTVFETFMKAYMKTTIRDFQKSAPKLTSLLVQFSTNFLKHHHIFLNLQNVIFYIGLYRQMSIDKSLILFLTHTLMSHLIFWAAGPTLGHH